MTRWCLVCNSPFVTPRQKGRPPETCSPECLNERKRQQRRETKERAIARGCPDDMHGTQTGASHYECRCTKCRMWWRDYQRARRAAQKAAVAEVTPEGKYRMNAEWVAVFLENYAAEPRAESADSPTDYRRGLDSGMVLGFKLAAKMIREHLL
jgi:hypothetical protein